MFFLPLSLEAFNTPTFACVLKREVCALDPELLPLQQGLQHSSYAISDRLSVTVLGVEENTEHINIRAGLLYNGIIAGCSCADDPSPTDETNEYCDVQFRIDKQTAETTVVIIR